LKNDHLTAIPKEITGLKKKLKVLELSGNDFSVLPEDFGS
jgi:Leucine-rich repeat (LRR) protein